MATRKVPGGDQSADLIKADEVDFHLWFCPDFPVEMIGGKLDKDPEEIPWILGLLDDIKTCGHIKNPLIVWNHHPHRGGKQPKWLIRAGSNRLWCVEQLGWISVPAIVSTARGERPPAYVEAIPLTPHQIQAYFRDGGVIWCNKHGFGLLRAKKPEETYKDYTPTGPVQITETHHGLKKIVNPLIEDN